tara:strand:+ start:971 stop:1372 length:402 start_codon:yes stop_codon:yes gene_type:complete
MKRQITKLNYTKKIIDTLELLKLQLNKKQESFIAICIQTIAETFQVKIPTDIGIHMYIECLNKYPNFIMQDVTKSIAKEYKYPRLPIPSEFINRCEPLYREHYRWYMKKLNTLIQWEHHYVNGFKQNKYLEEK